MNSIWKAATGRVPSPRIAFFEHKIKAGFPSPAEAYSEKSLNLQDLAVINPASTYFIQVSGDSMIDAGILPNDYLVVDRSLNPGAGDVVVAELMGEFTVKFLDFHQGKPVLVPANRRYPVIKPADGQALTVWGVVRGVYRNLK